MTWCEMTHEVKKLEYLITDTEKELIGFTLSGETYDGDGNIQDENGTNMGIVFKNKEHLKKTLNEISQEVFKGSYWCEKEHEKIKKLLPNIKTCPFCKNKL